MLSIDQIKEGVASVAPLYNVAHMSLFGSYAADQADENSDLDFLVEFETRFVSLLTLSGLKLALEDAFDMPVDVVHAPLHKDTLLRIEEAIPVYGQARQNHLVPT